MTEYEFADTTGQRCVAVYTEQQLDWQRKHKARCLQMPPGTPGRTRLLHDMQAIHELVSEFGDFTIEDTPPEQIVAGSRRLSRRRKHETVNAVARLSARGRKDVA